MAACGAKVLMLRCVEYARRYDVPIHVRSSYSDRARHHRRTDRSRTSHGRRHPAPESRTTAARPRSPSSGCPTYPATAAAGVPRARRRRRQHRHGAAEHLQDRGRQDRHHLHLLAGERPERGAEARRAAERDRLHAGAATTITSARCRWSARACAATPASPPRSARRCADAPASTSSLISTSEIRISVLIKDTELDKAVARAARARSASAATRKPSSTRGRDAARRAKRYRERDRLAIGVVGATGQVGQVMRRAARRARTSRPASVRFFASRALEGRS